MALSLFHPLVARWFQQRFGSPTEVQRRSWPAIASGCPIVISAPTGSGKTLAAFLACLDRLFRQAIACELEDRTQVLYVSPLKALGNDIHKNLQVPLRDISELALGSGFLFPEIRVAVRTGDTPASDRQRMLRRPPHILITTPESLYLLLTGIKSRALLRHVETVIVDEIHAVAGSKRGAHLALSLERLEAVTERSPQRIGLSATQRPLATVACYLVGARGHDGIAEPSGDGPSGGTAMPCRVIDVGHRREMDLAVEVPDDELGAVATNAIWSDIYDRLAELVRAHRSTLVFVNTRRLAERVAHHLGERLEASLGEDVVAAHHGSLSRGIRLSAEERLKRGTTRVVVATASLELGIDVGTVDLVCQIGSPRAIATCLQRVGRSGHWIGAVPKGRLFPATRDELIECAALIRAIRLGTLDQLSVPPAPLDILAQQIVAAAATQDWSEDELFQLCRLAFPYRGLDRASFNAVVRMLAEGITTDRGRGRALLHHDRINRRIRARRGARLAALTSGGAIPETATYAVVAEPEGTLVGTVDEDFAVESLAGDIILLGSSSWRIRGVGRGTMRVEDAQGAPPTIPFWRGEAPARTAELSGEVAVVRAHLQRFLSNDAGGVHGGGNGEGSGEAERQALEWLREACGLERRGAEQAISYIKEGRAVLGAVPTQDRIIAERFFDEGGGMQLVIHSPFGGRINRAWGMALRKRFCLTFDFELQAAATDEGLVLSLGERHSFPLEAVFRFVQAESVREVVTQAVLAAPMFATRWRWNATRALAVLRFIDGKKVPPQIQRMRAEDLLASVFPAATACQDNHAGGPREIPDHPLVEETVRDCLTEAMDIEGLEQLLRRLEGGGIACLSVETPVPSPFSHEILNANPYAYLDDAPLEERRARAVEMRRSLPPNLAESLGTLDPSVIEEVSHEAWPLVRDPEELHDALLTLQWVPEQEGESWAGYLPTLLDEKRATVGVTPCEEAEGDRALSRRIRGWVAAEAVNRVHSVFPRMHWSPVPAILDSDSAPDREAGLMSLVRGWMESIGPTTGAELAGRLGLSSQAVEGALLRLEATGEVLRGRFRPASEDSRSETGPSEWCHRRLLARIHRRTIGRLRREIEPVSAAEFMRFLFYWHHVVPGARLHGEEGLVEIISQLAGFEAAASAWEGAVLPVRLVGYQEEWLDRLSLGGTVMWGRLSPHPALEPEQDRMPANRLRRVAPTSTAPISLFPRDDAGWLVEAFGPSRKVEGELASHIGPVAYDLFLCLDAQGASFFADLLRSTAHLPSEVEEGLWELASAGLVTADGFDNLRALLDPRRRRGEGRERTRRPRHGGGRWSLMRKVVDSSPDKSLRLAERVARQLLRRYGVVFRDLLKRESLTLPWRDLLVQYRRLELHGEVRGGRFVSGLTGEQFALPEAVEALRALRRDGRDDGPAQDITVSAADPLNLVGVILPGPRIPSVPSQYITFREGVPVAVHDGKGHTAGLLRRRDLEVGLPS